MLDFQKLSADYQQALLRQVVPFWLKNGRDNRCGGYFDILTGTGEAVAGDKSVMMQAKQAWAFAWIYNTLDGQAAWLDHAQHGVTFLSQFAHSGTMTCYARLDRRGTPTAVSTTCTADCYVTMAYAQFYRATKTDEWAMLAKQTFSALFARWEEANGQISQLDTRHDLRHLSEAIALLSALLDMRPLLAEERWQEAVDAVLQQTLQDFLDRRADVLHEFSLPGARFLNTPEGRRLSVGLTCQLTNVLLDLCSHSSNRKLAQQAVVWCLRQCETAWDKTTGGIHLYIDVKNQPSPFSDAQQKWAWVHLEAIAALTKGYCQTQQPDCLNLVKRLHDFTFQRFPDGKHTGWHLAVDAHGQLILPTKSTPTVGCYSLIRGLTEAAQAITQCGQLQSAPRSARFF